MGAARGLIRAWCPMLCPILALQGDGLGDMLAAVHAALGPALDTTVVGAGRTTGAGTAGKGGWTEVGDMYSFITGVVWDSTVKAMFGDGVAGERQAFLCALARVVIRTISHVPQRPAVPLPRSRHGVCSRGSTSHAEGLSHAVLDSHPGHIFREFDKKFPLLIAGAPPGAVGATAAIETLRRCFAKPSLPGDVSELIEFRQTFLTDNFTPHNRESLQVGILWGSIANTMPTAFWAIFWAAKTPEVLERCVVEATVS